MELLARINAVLRRSRRLPEPERDHAFGDITVNPKTREVRKGGQLVDLLPREYRLLEYFVNHRGEVLERDTILTAVWGHDFAPPLTRTVDMHVARLRRKIEDDPGDPQWIVTVHRVGYKFTG